MFNLSAKGEHGIAQRNVKAGAIRDGSGEINIAGDDTYRGFTTEQISGMLAKIAFTFHPKLFDGCRPFNGLDVFEEEDTGLFFGHEKQIEDLPSYSACYRAWTEAEVDRGPR